MRSSAAGVMLLVAVIALVGCGDSDGSTGSTNSAGSADSNPVTTSTASSTTATMVANGGDGRDSGILVVEDEPYREPSDADGEGSTVDIYVGDGNEGGPVVVLLHGFSRTGPGRPDTDLGPFAEEIAELGATVFNFGWQSTWGFSEDSTPDLSCVGPFVAARAAEFGADPGQIIILGHSMGGEVGSMLALGAFDLDPSPNCTETGQAASPVAFVGIAGAYGMVGGPLDEDHTRFRVRSYPRGTFEELDADEEIVTGLTAAEIYRLDGYRAIPPVAELDIVLVVGSEDREPTANPDIAAAFAEELQAADVDAEVMIVEGGTHNNVVDPTTEHGQQSLQIIADLLTTLH